MIKWEFGLCIESASDEGQLRDIAYLARKAIEAVDENVEFNKKCDTQERLEGIRERSGGGPIWEDGPEI